MTDPTVPPSRVDDDATDSTHASTKRNLRPGSLLAGSITKKVAAGIAAGALVLGLVLGIVASPAPSTDPLTDPLNAQIEELDARLETAQARERDAIGARDKLEEEVADVIGDLEARESDVAAREAAVQATEETIAANSFSGNGVYIVGTDIEPGTYRSENATDCYWARLNLNGDDIIDNNIVTGQVILTVQEGDGLLEVSRCGQFTKVQ